MRFAQPSLKKGRTQIRQFREKVRVANHSGFAGLGGLALGPARCMALKTHNSTA